MSRRLIALLAAGTFVAGLAFALLAHLGGNGAEVLGALVIVLVIALLIIDGALACAAAERSDGRAE